MQTQTCLWSFRPLDKNQKWKKDGGDRLETLSLYSFFKHAGKAPSTEESARHREEARASKGGSPEYGSIYIHRSEPASIWSLVWWLFKGCPESLSRTIRDVREEKQGYEYGIAHPVYTYLQMVSASRRQVTWRLECAFAGHVTPGSFPLQSCWAGLALWTVFVNVSAILDLLLLSLYLLFVCSFCGFHLKHYPGRF